MNVLTKQLCSEKNSYFLSTVLLQGLLFLEIAAWQQGTYRRSEYYTVYNPPPGSEGNSSKS